MKHTILVLGIALYAFSCSTLKPGYAYTIGHPDSTLCGGSYISYGEDVFEYSLRQSGSPVMVSSDGSQHTEGKHRQDTVGIHYLNKSRRQFVTFRNLNDTSSIISKGKFSQKHDGLMLRDTAVEDRIPIRFDRMRDTSFAGVKLRYLSFTPPADTMTLLLYYLHKKAFTSIYDLIPQQGPDKDHHNMGMDLLVNGKPAPEMYTILTSFRPLTKEERKACETLRKRALASL